MTRRATFHLNYLGLFCHGANDLTSDDVTTMMDHPSFREVREMCVEAVGILSQSLPRLLPAFNGIRILEIDLGDIMIGGRGMVGEDFFSITLHQLVHLQYLCLSRHLSGQVARTRTNISSRCFYELFIPNVLKHPNLSFVRMPHPDHGNGVQGCARGECRFQQLFEVRTDLIVGLRVLSKRTSKGLPEINFDWVCPHEVLDMDEDL